MNNPTSGSTRTQLAARAEASAWITRLHGPYRSLEVEAGFQRWLGERPENSEEFEALSEIWDWVAAGAPARRVPRLERWEHTEESRELRALRKAQKQRSSSAWRLWALATLILASCGAITLGAYRFWAVPSYVTGVGEQRILRLEDGTRVSLDAKSRLIVEYGKVERRVDLEQGEAFFDVARSFSRPFVVTAGEHEVRAIGTTFVVRHDDQRVAITLVEGKIAVTPLSEGSATSSVQRGSGLSANDGVFMPQPKTDVQQTAKQSGETVRLSPGQRVTFSADVPPKLDTPAIDSVTAWRRGEVMLADMPLGDAIAEMSRYDKAAIVVDDPEISALTVSGLYHTGDSEGFARSVAKMYHLQVIAIEGEIHLKK